MVQRGARDRQHVRNSLEPGFAVFVAQQVGQTFQHVDANRTCASGAVTGHGVITGVGIRAGGHCYQTGGRAFGEFLQVVLQGPEHQPQPCRRGLQQQRQKDGELTKADTMLAQCAAGFLVQRLHLVGDVAAGDDAKVFGHAKGKALGQTGQRVVIFQRQQRLHRCRNLAVDEMLQAALHLSSNIRASLVINKSDNLGLHGIIALGQFAHGLIAPHQATLFGKIHFRVGGVIETVRPQMEMRHQRLRACLPQRLGLVRASGFVHTEPETFKTTDEFTLDRHFALVVYVSQEALLLFEPAKQYGCPPVHKSLRQCTM